MGNLGQTTGSRYKTGSSIVGGGYAGGGGTTSPPPSSGGGYGGGIVSAPKPPKTGGSGEFESDGARRMPVFNSRASIEAARRARARLMSRMGRSSTRFVSDAGTRSYVGSLLGNTQ